MDITLIKQSETFLNKILKITLFFFAINLFLFAAFLSRDIFFDLNFAGDEIKYLEDLLKANSSGLSKSISDGASITYLMITYLLDKIIDNPLFSLRITSLIFGTVMFYLLWIFNSKLIRIKYPIKVSIYFWIVYLFIIQTTIFTGVNDILLDFLGTLLFIVLYLEFKNEIIKYVFIGLLLALMLATRKMAITYISVFFLVSIFIIISSRETNMFNFRNICLIFLSFSIFFVLVNSYPLIAHQQFSFDDKILPGSINWAQWDYHNALLIDQGIQSRFQHVDIIETEKYLNNHGKNSLPSSFLEMIIFNPQLTIKEFFIDSFTGLKYIFRQTGLLIFPFTIFLFFRIKKMFIEKLVTNTDFIYLFCLCYFLIISFVVIANIQARWFMFFMPIMVLLIGKDLNKLTPKSQMLFSICNNILLTVMCFPYLFEKIKDLIN